MPPQANHSPLLNHAASSPEAAKSRHPAQVSAFAQRRLFPSCLCHEEKQSPCAAPHALWGSDPPGALRHLSSFKDITRARPDVSVTQQLSLDLAEHPTGQVPFWVGHCGLWLLSLCLAPKASEMHSHKVGRGPRSPGWQMEAKCRDEEVTALRSPAWTSHPVCCLARDFPRIHCG